MDRLFASSRFEDRLNEIVNKAVRAASTMDPDEILQRPPDRVVGDLFAKYKISATYLDRQNTTARVDETEVDVSGDFLRAVMDRSRPTNVQAARIEFRIPFEGPNIFMERASTYTLSSPYGRVEEGYLIVGRSIPLDVFRGTARSSGS